ncbi:MAG: HNH endonuclease signature motif containing protein [Bryobacteraceae bacterium]
MTKALQSAPRCAICGARVHRNSISIDHIKANRDGGRANEDNGQLTHPFCNSARDAIAAERELIETTAK